MPLTTSMQHELIDWLLRGQSMTLDGQTATWDAPPSLYVGLITSGTAEVSGGSYTRAEVACSLGNWDAPSGGATANTSVVTFPAPTANWGTVTLVGLYDAATAGTLLATGTLETPLPILNGDAAPTFPAGDLIFGVE